MSTTTEASPSITEIKTWDGRATRLVWSWTSNADPARLLLPFTERAFELPSQAEQVMREGLTFLAEFGGGPVEDEAALVRSARRFLNRNYPLDHGLIVRGAA